jgi:cellulose synthase/poly-beta-1,6-N-acetylglucosamine synthase-like glycosyltransferase
VAVEFEQIYAVSHPGRAALHGFGLFGGSNGFWRTSLLQRTRMHGRFLTEDIDATVRSILAGSRIVNDPGLVSRELAPVTAKALWRQRMRWAQGWFQVGMQHLWKVPGNDVLSLRQKTGLAVLLGWREVYAWLSPLVFPLVGFVAWRDGGLDLGSSLLLLATLYTVTAGPLQVLFAWRLAAPEVRARPWWFVWYAVVALLVYTEAKNVIARVAHVKQLSGERQWAVTPRTAPAALGGGMSR